MTHPLRVLFGIILAFVAFGVATQWSPWQTGRVPQAPLALVSGGPDLSPPERIWIDTDAACGATDRTDPDDCFAILWLVLQEADIAGVSTSYGNAPGDVAADRLAALIADMAQDGLNVPAVFRGHAEPSVTGSIVQPGVTGLRTALKRDR